MRNVVQRVKWCAVRVDWMYQETRGARCAISQEVTRELRQHGDCLHDQNGEVRRQRRRSAALRLCAAPTKPLAHLKQRRLSGVDGYQLRWLLADLVCDAIRICGVQLGVGQVELNED